MNRLLLHIALLLCAPRSFGYAIRTGLISAFAMRLYRQNKRKVFGDYNCFPLRTAIYICCPLRTANVVSLYSKRSDNISARTGPPFTTHRSNWMEKSANRKAKTYFEKYYGIDWNSSYIHPKHPRLTWTTIEDYYPTN